MYGVALIVVHLVEPVLTPHRVFRSSHAALQWQIGTVALIYDKACTSQSCWYQSIELDISLPDHE